MFFLNEPLEVFHGWSGCSLSLLLWWRLSLPNNCRINIYCLFSGKPLVSNHILKTVNFLFTSPTGPIHCRGFKSLAARVTFAASSSLAVISANCCTVSLLMLIHWSCKELMNGLMKDNVVSNDGLMVL